MKSKKHNAKARKKPFKPEKYYYVAVWKNGHPCVASLASYRSGCEFYVSQFPDQEYRIQKVCIVEYKRRKR